MFYVSRYGMIELARGDSFSHPIFINTGTTIHQCRHELQENERLYFGLMEPNSSFEHAIVKKVFDYNSKKNIDGDTLLILDPQDTEHLIPGRYFYTIKLQTFKEDGTYYVNTIVPTTEFWIL